MPIQTKVGILNSTSWYPCSPWCTSVVPIDFYDQLKSLPFWHQSMKYFSQSMRNVSDKFLSLVGFLRVRRHNISMLRVNWNNMFSVLVFWLSRTLKLFIHGQWLPFTSDLVFATKRQGIFVFLCSSVRISNVFLKALVDCWHIQITVGYLSTS